MRHRPRRAASYVQGFRENGVRLRLLLTRL